MITNLSGSFRILPKGCCGLLVLGEQRGRAYMQNPKILIVDDIPNNITILTEILKADYKLICATNGRDALKVSQTAFPELILLDVMMPDIDGYEVCRLLKADPLTRNIPVLFLTAKSEEADETKGLEIGAVDYISKPFSPVILKHKLRIHLDLKKHRDHLEEMVRSRTHEIQESHEKLKTEMADKLLAQEAFGQQRAYFVQLFENSPLAILLLNKDGRVIEVNSSFKKLFGLDETHVKDQYNKYLAVPEDLIAEYESFFHNILLGKTVAKETYRVHKNGNLIPVSFLAYPILIHEQVEGLFIIYEDISQRKRFEAQLLHQTFHDPLTGVPNRILLSERLERALERSKRYQDYTFAVMMVDLDRFKSVNDSLGHLAGDRLLVEVSKRIKECIRTTDTVARMGGDEFAVLVEEFKNSKEIFKIAERIHAVSQTPFIIERNEVNISASIGIVLETEAYTRADYILRDADIAMYRAKESGKARFKVFNKRMHEVTIELLQLENDLRNAIQKNQFILYYQPILSLSDSRLIGFEALVRWDHPERGIIKPEKFIPLAEETGLIIPLGQIVIREACRQLKDWHRIYPQSKDLTVSVNISVKQFMQSDLINFIVKVLSENNLSAGCLKLEITETLLVKEANIIIDKLISIKDIGLKVALDDFGTGYSSLSYIQNFPIDNIKIDRSFIQNLDTESGSMEIVKTIISLAKNLGLDVVAEGVERHAQLEMLRNLQCDNVQGFYFSQPVDSDMAFGIIKNYL